MENAGDADRRQEKRPGGDGGFMPGGWVSAEGTEFIQKLPFSVDLFKG
jgi:hypothetical protein